jgi:putative restriction endonuclease
LLRAYEGRCAITDCEVKDVLEAGHIVPYLGPLTNRTDNGLLLRADIHTLFDCGLISIDADTRTVVVADRLLATDYANLNGKALRAPKTAADAPSAQALARRTEMLGGRA